MPSQKAESERALSDSLQRALACRALERSIGVCDGFALGVLHRARCRLVMKLCLDGLRSRRSASPNLLLELRDLRRACPAIGSVAGACREGGAESNCGGKHNLSLAKHRRIPLVVGSEPSCLEPAIACSRDVASAHTAAVAILRQGH